MPFNKEYLEYNNISFGNKEIILENIHTKEKQIIFYKIQTINDIYENNTLYYIIQKRLKMKPNNRLKIHNQSVFNNKYIYSYEIINEPIPTQTKSQSQYLSYLLCCLKR